MKKDIIENVINILRLNVKRNDSHNKSHMCGVNRTRNKGKCMRYCKDIACSYHIKNIHLDLINKDNDVENNKLKKKNIKYGLDVKIDFSNELTIKLQNNLSPDIHDEKNIWKTI